MRYGVDAGLLSKEEMADITLAAQIRLQKALHEQDGSDVLDIGINGWLLMWNEKGWKLQSQSPMLPQLELGKGDHDRKELIREYYLKKIEAVLGGRIKQAKEKLSLEDGINLIERIPRSLLRWC